MVWSGPPFSDALPVVLSWAEHRAAGHVALALLSMTDRTYGSPIGLVALDAGGGRYVQVRGGNDAFELAAADGSFANPSFCLNRAQRQAMRRLRWYPPGPAPSHFTMSVQPPSLDMRPLAGLLLDTLVRGLGVEPDAPVRLQLWRFKPDERGRSLLADTLPIPSVDLGRWRPDMHGFAVDGLLNADLSGLLPFVLLTHDGPMDMHGLERHKPGLFRFVRYPEGNPQEEYGEGFLLPLAVATAAVRDMLGPICTELDSLADESTTARRRRAARLLGRAVVDGTPLGFRVLDAAPARGFVELAPSPALFRRLHASFAMASGLGTTKRYPIRMKAHAPFPFRRPADAMEWVWHDRGTAWHPFRAYLVTGPLSHLATFRRVRTPGTQQATPELDLVPWFKPRGRLAALDVRLVQEEYGVARCLLGTRRQRMAIDLHAHTSALADLVLWLKRLDTGDLPATVDLPSPGRRFALHAYAADRVGLVFLIGTVDGAPALQAVVRPRELARTARTGFMALVEDRMDHTLWPTPDAAYPPHVILPDPWFDDAVCVERAMLMNELIVRYDTVTEWGVFRGSTTQRLREICAHARAARPAS